MLSHEMKDQLVSLLHADLGSGDITSHILKPAVSRARLVAREPCILAGLEEAAFLFRYRNVKAVAKAKGGSRVKKGQAVLALKGKNINIFEVERTALNIVSRMSGVATACAEAQKAAGKRVSIALTRKTMPGFNLFDNRAAEIAGVWTHRINLNSFVLLKDNHVAFFERVSDAVLEARRVYGNEMVVEVEVDSLKQAFEAMIAEPDILMLDNFSPKEAKAAVKKLRQRGFSGYIELSGGISAKNLKQFAKCGASIISMGSLTQAVASKNFSLDIL